MKRLLTYLFILPFLCLAKLVFPQNQDLLKNFLTVENGLSHNEVTSIVQDKEGFIWIGTRGGLNRYDGYEFKIFNTIPGDSNSLVNPSIEALFVDSKGYIWIGTKSGGVSKYNPVTGVFENFASNYKTKNKILPAKRILCFQEDNKGRIWIGTWENGLFCYNPENNSFEHFLDNIRIQKIIKTDEGKMWIGSVSIPFSNSKLYEFKEETNELLSYDVGSCQDMFFDKKRNVIWLVHSSQQGFRSFDLRNNTARKFVVPNALISGNRSLPFQSVYVDKQDKLWIGTWGAGLYTFDYFEEKLDRYFIYPENRGAINKDYDAILNIFQDKDGNIWLGTNGGGVCVLTPKLNFYSVGYHPEANKGLKNTRIMSVIEDRNGYLWLGTIGSGLIWSPDRENFYPVAYPSAMNPERFLVIKNLFEDESGKIWAGAGPGTFSIDFNNGNPTMNRLGTRFRSRGFGRQLVSFLDYGNMLWLGSLQNGIYLVEKNENFGLIKRIHTDNPKAGDLHSNRFSYLLKDSKDQIWAGTYNGLHLFNPVDTTFNLVENQFEIMGELTGNIITCLDEDQKGNLWIGTPNGLNRLSKIDEGRLKIDFFTENDGLASNFIKGISHDLNGNIWFSTNVGISKLEISEEEYRIVNFDETDGVRGKNFTEASVFKNKKGEIFFGGTHGLTWFNPDEIVKQTELTKPILTGLSILNQAVEIGKEYNSRLILDKAISKMEKIVLSHHQNKIEIQFSALDFGSKGKNQYKFLLENHDENWNYIGNRRFIIFNNLRPGEYLLRVKSSNRHNIWNEEEAKLRIIVKPPFWQTWYALIFYILVVVGIVSVIRWNAVKQVRLANNLEMEKMQHEQDQRLNEMKLRFFTNLSHEFRTPLTLILAPLKELLKKKDEFQLTNETQNKINIAQNNSVRLMKLVNQLLDFRKIESGNMQLFASKTNLEEFVAEVCHPFFELAKINNISFKLNASLANNKIWIDRDKIEIVLNNLISNAFKHVPENGKIEIAIYEEEDVVLLCISDDGSGIPATEINNIYDRFYRVGRKDKSGTGIGLALAKRFTELNYGTLSVASEPGIHTEFTITLPKGKQHLKPNEIVDKEITEVSLDGKNQILESVLPAKQKVVPKSDDCILVVEDNREVREYLVSILEPIYCILTAEDGEEGYEKAVDKKPDLILSDVMMPNMDGFEFCKKIKTEETTSTIPFIFLTAKSDEQFRLLGTQLGAEDFISKPFDPNLLLGKVKNVLANLKKLQKQYSKSIRLEPSDIEITPTEEVFIEKTIALIEENLQNHKFSSDMLASEMHMSNSSLYRKLKSLTGSSTAEFIRTIRIKRAAQLLADRNRTITEIAYEIGFNDLKHFRTVFQKQFACSPSEYREKL